MKSEKIEDVKEEITYPCLMRGALGGVVLFKNPGDGTVVHADTKNYNSVGYNSKAWDMNNFKPFRGQIILSND